MANVISTITWGGSTPIILSQNSWDLTLPADHEVRPSSDWGFDAAHNHMSREEAFCSKGPVPKLYWSAAQ